VLAEYAGTRLQNAMYAANPTTGAAVEASNIPTITQSEVRNPPGLLWSIVCHIAPV